MNHDPLQWHANHSRTSITRRRALLTLAGFAAVPALAACGSDSKGRSTATTGDTAQASAVPSGALTTVRIGYIPVLPWSPFFVGTEKGYFREQGMQAELSPLAGGAEILTQTAAGNFEVGSGGSAAFFNVVGRARQLNQKQPIQVVAPLHLEKPPLATPLVVGKKAFDDGRVTRITDLRGKKVAINALGTATEYWLERALNTGGLSVKDVEVVGIPFPNIAQALDSGAIAGAVLTEPFATLGTRAGQVTTLTDRFLDGDLATIVFLNSEWAEKNPRVAQGFVTGYLKAVRDLEGGGWRDPATLAILSKYTNTPAETIMAAARPYSDPNGAINLASLESQQTFFKAQGRLTYEQPVNLASVIDGRYAQEAVKSLGPFKP